MDVMLHIWLVKLRFRVFAHGQHAGEPQIGVDDRHPQGLANRRGLQPQEGRGHNQIGLKGLSHIPLLGKFLGQVLDKGLVGRPFRRLWPVSIGDPSGLSGQWQKANTTMA